MTTIAVLAVGALVAIALPTLRRALRWPGALPAVVIGSAIAVYGCVPETSNQMPTVFTIVGAAFLAVVTSRQLLPVIAIAVGVVAVGWGGLYGATGQERAIIGTLYALWPLVLIALVGTALGRFGARVTPARADAVIVAAALTGVISAIAVARTGALQPGIAPALGAAVVAGSISLALMGAALALARRGGPPDHPPDSS